MSGFLESPSAYIALATVLGLIVGSFLNVVILRLPARLMHAWRQQSREILELPTDANAETVPPGIVWESSHCPKCKHSLSAFENIPLDQLACFARTLQTLPSSDLVFNIRLSS